MEKLSKTPSSVNGPTSSCPFIVGSLTFISISSCMRSVHEHRSESEVAFEFSPSSGTSRTTCWAALVHWQVNTRATSPGMKDFQRWCVLFWVLIWGPLSEDTAMHNNVFGNIEVFVCASMSHDNSFPCSVLIARTDPHVFQILLSMHVELLKSKAPVTPRVSC